MPRRPLGTLMLAIAILAGAGTLLLLEWRCDHAGGHFRWTKIACEVGARPIILQGDIHRV